MIPRNLIRIAESLIEMVEGDTITPETIKHFARQLGAQAEMIEQDCIQDAA